MHTSTRITAQPILRAASKRRNSLNRGSAWWTQARFSSTVHENDATTLELEKARNLKNIQHKTSTPHKQHAPGWNEYLATSSEAYIKADKGAAVTLTELQETTVQHIFSRHADDASTNASSSNANYEATFSQEHVGGPLSGAGPGEEPEHEEKKKLVRRTVHEHKTGKWDEQAKEVGGTMTGSEQTVKADREES
ncbi:hypothetical protein C8F01DRAFT_1245452 [Mycena amicta]|nr:hypothetical protein C8F01DRAFT_1245452 [Mycena amicta]